jgi:hypothetical protein
MMSRLLAEKMWTDVLQHVFRFHHARASEPGGRSCLRRQATADHYDKYVNSHWPQPKVTECKHSLIAQL